MHTRKLLAVALAAHTLCITFSTGATQSAPLSRVPMDRKAVPSSFSPAKYVELARVISANKLTACDFKRIQSAIEENEKDPHANCLLGMYFQGKGFINLAETHYRRAWEADRHFSDPLIMLTGLLIAAGSDELKRLTDEVLVTNEVDANTLLRLAHLMHLSHQRDQEAQLYKRAEELKPDSSEIATARAFALLGEAKYNEALAESERGLKRDPKNSAAWIAKGRALIGLKQRDKAIEALAAAYRLNSDDSQLNEMYASLLLIRGRYEEALQPLLFILARNTDNKFVSLRTKERLQSAIRRLPDAAVQTELEQVSKALAGLPQQAMLHFAMGDVFDKLDRRKEAILQYRAGLALEPGFARGLFRLGKDLEIYCRDFDSAANYYRAAYAAAPQDEEIRLAYGRLLLKMANRNDLSMKIKNSIHRHPQP